MEFRPLTPEDHDRLKPFFVKQSYRLCNYSLPALLVWSNDIYKPYGAVTDDSLIIYAEYGKERARDRHLILPISPTHKYSPEELCQLGIDLGFQTVRFVPEDYLKRYGQERIEKYFKIEIQEGYHDYIYWTSDMASLKGNKYSKKRNLIHQFQNSYIHENRVEIHPVHPNIASECITFLDKWCDESKCSFDTNEELNCERQAIILMLRNLHLLDVEGLILRLDGEISAFGIGTRLTDIMGVLHFQKAFSSIKGLYQYFDQLCAQRLFKEYPLINKEGDMGVPGLAKAKRSYHPVEIVKSFKLIRH